MASNRILIVEDSLDLLDLTKELLESEGYEVYCASNGKEALDLLRRTQVKMNLILLDLMMPVMNGQQFRQEQLLDTNLATIPVVVITADGNAQTKAQQLGVKGCYNKASGIDKLLEIIKCNLSDAST